MLKKLLAALAAVLLVPILLFEEWGWEPLARVVAQLTRLPLWARFERWLRSLPPWAALLAFFVPMGVLFPIKLLGLFLLGEGHGLSALLLLLAAKVIGTAIVARLFQLLEPTLMRIPLFARWYPRWKTWKDRMLSIVRASATWRVVRRLKDGARRRWRQWRGTA
ncbi:hypothetical protein [Variovorax sp. PBL-E5]|uniref:hypothetical protein n=1 Tax=Variovorax sp. PBL-E5 TaxID=434014 RepID=UPI001317671A|nr:hypothetical protein [Variovorax sp. PBL-E5]VTU28810.1 hypothetical protein E5CHR_02684 [Variovorax sp. PBL-E5]